NPTEKFAKLRESSNPQAQFLWAIFRDLFHYCAYHLAAIADNARDVDFAIRWGFGWQMGPFEIWQAAGWKEEARWLAEDMAAGEDVLDGLLAAIAEAEKNWRGLVIWQTREPFSVGANLVSVMPAVQAGKWDQVEAVVAKFQLTAQRLKYSLIPTVAAVRGMAL